MKIILRYHLAKLGRNPPTKPFGWYEAEENYEPQDDKYWTEFEGTKEDIKNYPEMIKLTEKELDPKKKPENPHTILLLAQRRRQDATESIVNYIKEQEIIKTTKNDEKPEMWIYKEGIYLPNAKTTINWYCRSILGRAYTTQLSNEVINKLMADTYVDEKEFFYEQNKRPELIPVKNGLLNLKTKLLHEFTHKTPYFNKINAEYRPEADCPKIKEFLSQILPSEKDQQIVQEMLGFCLLREYRYEKAFMLYGGHGRNGKSKLLELIKRFMGIDNISGVSLEDIEKDDFAISNLHNKLVNISGDISNEAIKNTGKFKSLVGRDTISANRKFKNRIDFVNYAKIIFAANELPPVYTMSRAFWLRWVFIEFPYQFLPEKEISSDDDKARLQDPDIIDKITTQEEIDGLLNYAIVGLDRLMKNKDFSTTSTAKEIQDDWQRKSNSVIAFCKCCVEEHFDGQIVKQEFLRRYKNYCDDHQVKQMSNKQIKITLKELYGADDNYVSSIGGFRQRVWEGVKWRS